MALSRYRKEALPSKKLPERRPETVRRKTILVRGLLDIASAWPMEAAWRCHEQSGAASGSALLRR